jgi:ubiquinone/menaquinone biosynthesis C-methylase UbiE
MPPDPLADTFTNLVAARAVTTATTTGLFDALAEAEATPAELAERLGADPLGTETLVAALTGLGYLEPAGEGRLRNGETAARLLVSSSPESIATFVGRQADLHWEILTMLPEAVRHGTAYAMHEERRDPERWDAYIRGLFEISREEQDLNAALVPVEAPRRLVDVAGGHGGFAMAMCRRHPDLSATVVDLPPSLAVGRAVVEEQGYADRVGFVEGDVFEVALGEDIDVVSVFNLIHHLPEERDRELVRMARSALRPGGALVVGDTERPDPADPLVHGALSSLLFYTWSHSRNFTRSEVAGWLEDAGFGSVEVHRNERSPWRIVVVGRVPQ